MKTPIQEMKVVRLQGILMPNKEFICHGKSLFLTDEEIEKFVEERE